MKTTTSFIIGLAAVLLFAAGLGAVAASFFTGTDQVVSTVATGTAPFTVASTTTATNLNADYLGGYHATDFRKPCTLKLATVAAYNGFSNSGTLCTNCAGYVTAAQVSSTDAASGGYLYLKLDGVSSDYMYTDELTSTVNPATYFVQQGRFQNNLTYYIRDYSSGFETDAYISYCVE